MTWRTIPDAARELRCNPETLRRALAAGKTEGLQVVRIGDLWRIRLVGIPQSEAASAYELEQEQAQAQMDDCAQTWDSDADWLANHRWNDARSAALERDEYRCVQCAATERLEVNHIEPRRGKGYGPGCHHHQSNLETLCKPCHQQTTREQRAVPV